MSNPKVIYRTEKLSNLILADWNYKEDDEAMKNKLKAGIKQNGFLMNLVIRKKGDKFEVVDGNHRLVALQEIGYKDVQVCDVGEVTQEQAYMISLALNETSFDNNEWLLNTLMKDLSKEYSVENLEQVLPYSTDTIENMISAADIDFDNLINPAEENKEEIEGFNTITLQLKDGAFETWNKWCRQVENRTGVNSKAAAFEEAIAKAVME